MKSEYFNLVSMVLMVYIYWFECDVIPNRFYTIAIEICQTECFRVIGVLAEIGVE
jgi:hypothetical protein